MAKSVSKRKEETKVLTPEELKEMYPLYPIVRREQRGTEVVFKTLVRKRYGGEQGKYYLIPMEESGIEEAKIIHSLHASVYSYLMLGVKILADVVDSDQLNEVKRLNSLK